MDNNYIKYLKYKTKYLNLKKHIGGEPLKLTLVNNNNKWADIIIADDSFKLICTNKGNLNSIEKSNRGIKRYIKISESDNECEINSLEVINYYDSKITKVKILNISKNKILELIQQYNNNKYFSIVNNYLIKDNNNINIIEFNDVIVGDITLGESNKSYKSYLIPNYDEINPTFYILSIATLITIIKL